jgi:hypothetical protein
MDFVTTLPAPITAVADADGQNRGAAADRHVIANLNPPPAGAVGVWFAVAKQIVGNITP